MNAPLRHNLDVAIAYARIGLPVFPCDARPHAKRPDSPSKRPLLNGGFKDACCDEDLIREWWRQWPDALVGLACGASNLVVVDCDRHGGPDGVAEFERLAKANGMPNGHVVVTTQSGGAHLIFKQPSGEPLGNSEGALTGKGINVRGDGGYIIAPGTTWRDRAWREAVYSIDLVEAASGDTLPEPPEWLVTLIRGKPETLSERAKPKDRANGATHAGDEFSYIRAALDHIDADDRDTWLKVGGALHDSGESWARMLWDDWSRRSPKFDARDQDATWASYRRSTGRKSGMGTIVEIARANGFNDKKNDYRDDRQRGNGHAPHDDVRPEEPESVRRDFDERINVGQPEHPTFQAPRIRRFSEFFDVPPPARRWFIPNWIPAEGEVTLFYGDGGIGKSLMTMQLQVAGSLNQNWLGLDVEPGRSLGIYAEDNENEIHRRIARILSHKDEWGLPEAYAREALDRSSFVSRVGEDNLLMTFSKSGKGEVTPFQKWIIERALDEKVGLVALDHAAAMFAGNAVEPSQVRQFVSVACGGIATKIDGAVLLLAHPSQSAMRSGDGGGYGVQWNAAARSRLYIDRIKDINGVVSDPRSLILSRKKGNYADVEALAEVRIKWDRGIVIRDTPNDPAHRPPVKDVFLALLDIRTSQSRHVSAKSRGSTYAPKVFSQMKEHNHGYNKDAFEQAMERLFAEGGIENQEIKVDRKPLTVIARKEGADNNV